MTDAFLIDKQQVRRSFERAAKSYDQVAVLQRLVADRMAERLQFIKHRPSVILDAGCGTGYARPLLQGHYADARLISLDLALGMLHIARGERPSWWQKMLPAKSASSTYICGDLEALPLQSGSVDLLWSSLALQWCNDLDAAFSGMRRVLAPNGLLMFSTFGPDTLRELRQAFAKVDGYHHVSRFQDMHDIGDALMRAGFAEPVMDMEYFTLTYDSASGLMRDLKALGAHNATQGRRQGLAGKSAWKRMESEYEKLRQDGKLPATYEVIYGHAWAPNQLPDGRQVVQMPVPGQRGR
ncbi:MAG: malonyl-ACP O-methyltransferase BioC [Sulfuricella denitrificans]|nr:malonyl-ACP O-methyltransferase BioC [Sulfuricella denitrificans]